jgi:hypothetical protein
MLENVVFSFLVLALVSILSSSFYMLVVILILNKFLDPSVQRTRSSMDLAIVDLYAYSHVYSR